jgi:hypothetical protein
MLVSALQATKRRTSKPWMGHEVQRERMISLIVKIITLPPCIKDARPVHQKSST